MDTILLNICWRPREPVKYYKQDYLDMIEDWEDRSKPTKGALGARQMRSPRAVAQDMVKAMDAAAKEVWDSEPKKESDEKLKALVLPRLAIHMREEGVMAKAKLPRDPEVFAHEFESSALRQWRKSTNVMSGRLHEAKKRGGDIR